MIEQLNGRAAYELLVVDQPFESRTANDPDIVCHLGAPNDGVHIPPIGLPQLVFDFGAWLNCELLCDLAQIDLSCG